MSNTKKQYSLSLRMKIVTVSLALLCIAQICHSKKDSEPSVAFVCGKGAMHFSQDAGIWASDTATDCLERKADILEYCKKVYPKLDVTNIVEASSYKHIRGWCPLNGQCDSQSEEAFKVRPYRCLTGPFQSDALIVPKACHFDHVLEDSLCKDFDYWKEVATKSCLAKKMNTDNFAMLMPCDTDVFTGVEFVCCPNGLTTQAPTDTTTPMDMNKKMDSADITIVVESEPHTKLEKSEDSQAEFSVIDKYLHMKAEAYATNEHDAFKLAKKQLNKVNHDKVARLMDQWSDAKKRVEDMKKTNPKGAEKLNKEITPRFQKEYFALQLDVDNRMIQLDSAHQQHIQTNFNSKKRKTAEKLMEALQASKVDADTITKYLQRYVAIEEKDAHHCLQHYIKMRNQDPSAAEQMLPVTLEHLSLISQRINQSLDLLSTLKDEKLEEQIADSVRSWLTKSYTSIDLMVTKLKEAPSPKIKAKVEQPKLKDSVPVTTEAVTKPTEASIKKPEAKSDGFYKKYADKLIETDFVKKMKSLDEQPPVVPNSPEIVAVESPKAKVSHMAKGGLLVANSNSLSAGVALTQGSTQLSSAAILSIIFGILAAVFVISFSVIIVKKRSSASGKSNNYLEVAADDNVTAEDRHIASMQNGYENPTYKLLERRA